MRGSERSSRHHRSGLDRSGSRESHRSHRSHRSGRDRERERERDGEPRRDGRDERDDRDRDRERRERERRQRDREMADERRIEEDRRRREARPDDVGIAGEMSAMPPGADSGIYSAFSTPMCTPLHAVRSTCLPLTPSPLLSQPRPQRPPPPAAPPPRLALVQRAPVAPPLARAQTRRGGRAARRDRLGDALGVCVPARCSADLARPRHVL